MEESLTKLPASKNSRKRWLVIALIAIGVILVGLFGFRTARNIIRMRQMQMHPLSTDVELIRGWMTVPYVSDSYRVPPEYLAQTCKLPPPQKHENLSQINRAIDPDHPGSVVTCIKTAVSDFQKSYPTPPGKPQ